MTVDASSLRRLDERLLALFRMAGRTITASSRNVAMRKSCADRRCDEYGRIGVPDRFECS
jgi:hypothetical protein